MTPSDAPKTGDPVEIRFATPTGDLWRPATVVYSDRFGVAAAFNDGSRVVVPMNQGRWRAAPEKDERR